MHRQRPFPATVPSSDGRGAPPRPAPGLATRAPAEAALALLASHGERAPAEARARAAAALARDNLWSHARWRQVTRLLAALAEPGRMTH